MPPALETGRYASNGFQLRRHLHQVRPIGLPLHSTWVSAASSFGVMTVVGVLESEWARIATRSAPGAFTSELLTERISRSACGLPGLPRSPPIRLPPRRA